MRILHYATIAAMGVAVGLQLPQIPVADKLTAKTLKNMAAGLGYSVKDLNTTEGKEKFEITVKTKTLDVPVGLEISSSGNYVWLTAFLNENKATLKHEDLLRENFNIQPTFFYVTTKDNLFAAQAIDNRNISPAVFSRCVEKLVTDIEKTAKVWGD
jgi:hypothetical protein